MRGRSGGLRSLEMDELLDADGSPRPIARDLIELIQRLGIDEVRARQRVSDLEILTMGISFTVYSDGENIDRAWPFDIIPRLIDGREWAVVERGLAQRLRALNRFIDDIYNDQQIIADGGDPDYDGIGGPYEFVDAGEPAAASFRIGTYDGGETSNNELDEYVFAS